MTRVTLQNNSLLLLLFVLSAICTDKIYAAAGGAGTENPSVFKDLEGYEEVRITLGPYRSRIEETARDYVAVETKPMPEDAPLWVSKFGGMPFLPETIPYPADADGIPFRLIAQLNFAELPNLPSFPKKGLLQIYVLDDSPYFDFRTIYIPDIDKDAKLHDLSEMPERTEDFPVKKEFALGFTEKRMPISTNDRNFKRLFPEISANFDLESMYNECFAPYAHTIGGYPSFDQGDDIRKPEDDKDILLLHMDSENADEIMWGDGGRANFFISQANLEALKLSEEDILYYWDCG